MLKSSSYMISLFFFLMIGIFSETYLFIPENKTEYTSSDRIKVAAHRGLHKEFPENSIAAIQQCIDKGIDIVEIDIRETLDHVPVLLHDKTLNRTAGYNYKVSDLTFNEIRDLKLLFNGKPTLYGIPSLEEVLHMAKGKIIINLDFKLNDLEALYRVSNLIAKYGMEKEVIITIKDHSLIPELHAYNEHIRMMPVTFSWWKLNSVMRYDYLDIIQLFPRSYWKYNINRMENRQMEIWVNALNKYDLLEEKTGTGFEKLLYIKKVDVIQTDHPEKLLNFLKQKGLHD